MFSGEVLLDSCALMKSAFWSVIPVLWYCVGVGFDWMIEREKTGISPGLAPFFHTFDPAMLHVAKVGL